jgi:hypothetical protein
MARIAIVHQDLIIGKGGKLTCFALLFEGGAERLIVDAATCLQAAGDEVTIYCCHHPLNNSFPETQSKSALPTISAAKPKI